MALGLTVTPDLYKNYNGKLSLSGLSSIRNKEVGLIRNLDLYKNVFLLEPKSVAFK